MSAGQMPLVSAKHLQLDAQHCAAAYACMLMRAAMYTYIAACGIRKYPGASKVASTQASICANAACLPVCSYGSVWAFSL